MSNDIKNSYVINIEKSKDYFSHFSLIHKAERQCVITDSQGVLWVVLRSLSGQPHIDYISGGTW